MTTDRENLALDILHTYGIERREDCWIVPPDFRHSKFVAGDGLTGTALEVAEELGLAVPDPATCQHRNTGRGVCADCGTFL